MALLDSWEGNVIALSRIVATSTTDCLQSNVSVSLLRLRVMPSLLANGCDFNILQVTGMELWKADANLAFQPLGRCACVHTVSIVCHVGG